MDNRRELIDLSREISLFLLFCVILPTARAERIWWDGTRDGEDAPPGKLLSDNAGYWGECVNTGVEYTYESAPDSPPDSLGPDTGKFGRRLLDGVPAGDWHAPVGAVNRPLVAIFDFKRPCTFHEIDLCTRSRKAAIRIECGDSPKGPWRLALERPLEQSPDTAFHRLPLALKPEGRYLRLSFNAVAPPSGVYLTYLEEVVVWGDVMPGPPTGNIIPVAPGETAKAPAVWSRVATWDAITDRPILPAAPQLAKTVALLMARNETENAALALTNTSINAAADGTVALGPFRRVGPWMMPESAPLIVGSLRVAGAIRSRNHGAVIAPLFTADNLPGADLLRRHLTNADQIRDFPRLQLPPAGSVVVWLSVAGAGAQPGIYEAELSFKSGETSPGASLTVRVEVLDVTLPHPPVWLQTWSGTTGMFPFVYADRLRREVTYKQSLGVTAWSGFPTPGSASELARKSGKVFCQIRLLPDRYVEAGYSNQFKSSDLTPAAEEEIAGHVRAQVLQAKALGLGYDDWFGELWDEPGRANSTAFGELARLIRKIDPEIRIYSNPCFWENSGTPPDEVIEPLLAPWYSELVDVSVPLELLLRDHPGSSRLFDAPRWIRASYRVSTHGDKNERSSQVDSYRRQAWDAFARGYNGWGFYSYYAPIGDPWDDFDGPQPDYQMVYPGPRGPIATRTSENVREGWEDYRLLTLLKQRGLHAEVASLLAAYAAGDSTDALRLQALRLMGSQPSSR